MGRIVLRAGLKLGKRHWGMTCLLKERAREWRIPSIGSGGDCPWRAVTFGAAILCKATWSVARHTPVAQIGVRQYGSGMRLELMQFEPSGLVSGGFRGPQLSEPAVDKDGDAVDVEPAREAIPGGRGGELHEPKTDILLGF